MRRAVGGLLTAALAAVALWQVPGAPAAAGADTTTTTTTTTTTATTTTSTANEMVPANRGTAVQVEPTLAPPPAAPTPATPSVGLPAGSGSGRRVVYVKSQMRVWIIDAEENIQRTYLVSGRLNQPTPGTYHVFSRSTYTCNINHSNVCMRWMVRFAHGPGGDNIGFHEIPRKNGAPVQGNHQLGQALSSGCVRQSTDDAQFMWAWAGIGTTVVVIQ